MRCFRDGRSSDIRASRCLLQTAWGARGGRAVAAGAGGGGRAGAGGARVGQGSRTALRLGAVAFGLGGKGNDVRSLQEAIQGGGHQARRSAQGRSPVVDAAIGGQNG